MNKIYGYCRISTNKQSIERQIRNIKAVYPGAIIIQEVYTGTTTDRKEWNKLIKIIKSKDIIVFDSVSRMSRNAEQGIETYKELFEKDINLVFIKEPHINTETYKKALEKNIELTNSNLDYILNGINKYLLSLAEEQIRIAFEQAEKEVKDLSKRTSEGLVTAKLNGKRVGTPKGTLLTTKKSIKAKDEIIKYSRDFKGSLNDVEVIKLIGINRMTYYKYKKELKEN